MSSDSHHTVVAMASQPMKRRSQPLDKIDPTSGLPYKTHRRVRGYLDGCFDVMHSGHYNLFRQARLMCDELIVGVHSAAEIEKTKGCEPVQTDVERIRLVGCVKWVDEVVLSTQYSPDYMALIEKYDLDFVMHGSDVNRDADGKDPFAEVKKAGKFRAIERVDFISSTTIINRLLKATHPDPRVQRRSEDEEDADSFLLTTDRLCQFMNTTRHQPHVPREGQRVVYVSGSWDLFHSGHVRLLQECKALGDFLLVGIHEDTTVQIHAGPGFPIMSLFERAMNVLGCRDVDEVVFDAPFVTTPFMIDFLGIDVVVEPSLRIDYPNDSSDSLQLVRHTAKCSDDGLADRLKKAFTTSSAAAATSGSGSPAGGGGPSTGPKGQTTSKRKVELVRVELPEAEVLQSRDLHKRITDNRDKYEARNKGK